MALVGKNNHQSILDDNASLFQIHEEKTEKQKWTELDSGQRLHYFIDYYLLKCMICVIILAISIFLIWSFLKPEKERMLFITVVENSLVPDEKENLEQILTEMFITDTEKQEIRIDDTFPKGYESDAKLSAYLNAQEIDLIITNEEHFQQLAKTECYEDLNEFMPELASKYSDLLCWAKGYAEEDTENGTEDTTEANVTSETEDQPVKAYGIDITSCTAFKDAWYAEEKAVIGVVRNSQQKENSKKVLSELFFLEN